MASAGERREDAADNLGQLREAQLPAVAQLREIGQASLAEAALTATVPSPRNR